MNIEEKSAFYLERLLARLAEIKMMPSPSKRMQATIDLRRLFEEAIQEGIESNIRKSEHLTISRHETVNKPFALVKEWDLVDF